MKVKKTYRFEEETVIELEELCNRNGKTATEAIEDAIHYAVRLPYAERADDGGSDAMVALIEQLAVKDGQIADLNARFDDVSKALLAAQETAKAAQALHAANVQQTALESSEQKERRRWRWPWGRQG